MRLIDQRALPARVRFVECSTVGEVCTAIRGLVVRGAPALGATGAFGIALAARSLRRPAAVRRAADRLVATRPTAVNLAWGVGRALDGYERGGAGGALAAARALAAADVAVNRALGRHGATLVPDGARVLTHCNAGSLACVGYGTALGVIRAATERGRRVAVWVGETRPVLQGARLTAWELARLGIPVSVIVDAAAGSLLAAGEIDIVVVGADRIAANGDVANKIGTYPLAVLASRHGIPFYVAAPTSTIDLACADGASLPVEERAAGEVRALAGRRLAPTAAAVRNPAFDVTPSRLVSAVVTEEGVLRPPYRRALRRVAGRGRLR